MALNFALNGEKIVIPLGDVDPGMTLNDYIRQQTSFKGTKKACGEGGCGSCAVAVSKIVDGKKVVTFAVNSCLRPLAALDGCAVTTVEGLSRCTAPAFSGSQPPKPSLKNALHPVTERFSARSSLQCGFCTPGMVMSLYSSLQNGVSEDGQVKVSARAMEDCTDGNICRCTGYRPILEACRSFAVDSTETPPPDCSYSEAGKDLGLAVGPYSSADFDPPFPSFLREHTSEEQSIRHKGKLWFRPTSLESAMSFWAQNPSARVVAGCTSWGIYKDDSPFRSEARNTSPLFPRCSRC